MCSEQDGTDTQRTADKDFRGVICHIKTNVICHIVICKGILDLCDRHLERQHDDMLKDFVYLVPSLTVLSKYNSDRGDVLSAILGGQVGVSSTHNAGGK